MIENKRAGRKGASPSISRTPALINDGASLRPRWEYGPAATNDRQLLESCVRLFNEHYGIWGSSGPSPGSHVKISVARLIDLLTDEAAGLACMFDDQQLVGYCVVSRFDFEGRGDIHWVSQLVVAETYRKLRVATTLLYSAWQFSDSYAWGLATANPFAIRALETATRRHCRRKLIVERGDGICAGLSERIQYIPPRLSRDSEGRILPMVDTKFFIDHSDVRNMKERSARGNRRWELGPEPAEGHEWLGAIFSDQPVADVRENRLEHLLDASDESWIDAYSRMPLDDEHKWHRHAAAETEFILERLASQPKTALDAGCGSGRHALELAGRGIDTLGVDIVPAMLERAETHLSDDLPLRIEYADLRVARDLGTFDLIISLYDVLGSSPGTGDAHAILNNFVSQLSPEGHLILSVMNAAPMLSHETGLSVAHSEDELVRLLEQLPSSNRMESSGNVFDPNQCLLYQGVFHRKETFTRPGENLPREIVVRDRRFTISSITELLTNSGLQVDSVAPVQSGKWDVPLDEVDPKAKELLIFASLPAHA